MKRQTNMAGTKSITSKQMGDVKKQRGPASGNIDSNTKNTVGLEKVVPLVFPRKIKVPTTILSTVADGRFKARVVTPGWMQRHGTDRTIVAAKNKFDRSQNSALD